MAHHQSAKKSIRQNIRRAAVNRARVSKIRTYVKKVEAAITSGTKPEAQEALRLAQQQLMLGVKKNVLKLNTASRKVSRLSSRIKAMG